MPHILKKTTSVPKKNLRRLAVCLLSAALLGTHAGIARAEEAPEEPQGLYALSACLMDAQSGRVLFEKEGEVHRANASTTKILTLILTLERCELSETVTVSERAQKQPRVRLGIKSGECYRLEDLCYSLMLESHNDAAVAIAEHVGGSVEGFAVLMNEKANELGCTQSYFLTPNGLDEEDETNFHGTSAVDLSRIMSYCVLRSPKAAQFLEITRTQEYTFTDQSGSRSFSCRNHNAFLQMMDGALSGKTGFTADAGYCYVGALERDGRTFVVALLGCGWPNNKSYKWSDCRQLFTYGLENYTCQTCPQSAGSWEGMVSGGAPKNGDPYTQAQVRLMEETHEPVGLLVRSDERLICIEKPLTMLTAPVSYGQTCGEVCYYLEAADGSRTLLYRADICAQGDIAQKSYGFYLRYLLKRIV